MNRHKAASSKDHRLMPVIIILGIFILLAAAAVVFMLYSLRGTKSAVSAVTQEEIAAAEAASSEGNALTESVDGTITITPEGAATAADAGEDALNNSDPDSYILPDSSTRALTEADLSGLSSEELRYARNEIYARHGRKFDDAELQAYFNGKSWYTATTDPADFKESSLSQIEKDNISFIKEHE